MILKFIEIFIFLLSYFQRAAFLAATKHVRPSQSIDVLDESPPALASLRDRCWHKDPLERPAFSVALSELGDIDVTPQGSSSGTGTSDLRCLAVYSQKNSGNGLIS